MGKIVAYLRVSTENQTEKFGLDIQRNKILELAEKRNEKIEEWFADGGYSGANTDRPALQSLIEKVEQSEIGTVYIYKLDRVSRDVVDTLTILYKVLNQYGVNVISATEDLKFNTPMDKVVIGVNAIMGQYEREVIKMRTISGIHERAKKGLWHGGTTPFGYKYDRNKNTLVPSEQAKIVPEIFKDYISGKGLRSIGKKYSIHHYTIYHILSYRVYLGELETNIGIVKGVHQPLIDAETFERAQIEKNRRKRGVKPGKHLLSNLCVCGRCGKHMSAYTHRDKFYCVTSDGGCGNKFRESVLNASVEESFKQFRLKISKQEENQGSFLEQNEKVIKRTKAKISKLYDIFAEEPENEELRRVIKKKEEELSMLEKSVKNVENAKKGQKIDFEAIKSIGDVWDNLSIEDKNRILKMCIDKVVISADGEKADIFYKLGN